MKKSITKILTSIFLLTTLHSTAYAGAEVVVTQVTGGQIKWQFENMEDAGEFLADRIESGRCANKKVASVEIKSVYIDGIDNPEDKFAWYRGVSAASL